MASRTLFRTVILTSWKINSALIPKYCTRNVITNPTPICTRNTTTTSRYYSQNSPEMTVEFEHVKNAINNSNTVIIDVREPDELKEHGKIPNSVNIPLGSVETALQMPDSKFEQLYQRKKPSANSEIIFYCMIGKRSAKAQEYALKLGFQNAKNYLGSFQDWASKHERKL